MFIYFVVRYWSAMHVYCFFLLADYPNCDFVYYELLIIFVDKHVLVYHQYRLPLPSFIYKFKILAWRVPRSRRIRSGLRELTVVKVKTPSYTNSARCRGDVLLFAESGNASSRLLFLFYWVTDIVSLTSCCGLHSVSACNNGDLRGNWNAFSVFK